MVAKNYEFVAVGRGFPLNINSFFQQVEEDNMFEVGPYCLNLSYPFSI